jgi:hypothetical protein
MRLFLSGLFYFQVGRALVHFALEFVTGLLELSQALSNPSRKLWQLLRSEKQNEDNENEESFWPTGHTKGDW